jgi:hypothetical protein
MNVTPPICIPRTAPREARRIAANVSLRRSAHWVKIKNPKGTSREARS